MRTVLAAGAALAMCAAIALRTISKNLADVESCLAVGNPLSDRLWSHAVPSTIGHPYSFIIFGEKLVALMPVSVMSQCYSSAGPYD